jgi:hypothetical protein
VTAALIDRRGAGDHQAVGRQPLARAHEHSIANRKLAYRNDLLGAARGATPRGRRYHVHQRAQRSTRAMCDPRIQHLAQGVDDDQHRRLLDDPEDHGADDGEHE